MVAPGSRASIYVLVLAVPVFLTNGDQLNDAWLFAQNLGDLYKKLFLQVTRDVTGKGAILNTIQAIIQAGVSNLQPLTVIRNVVNEQAVHIGRPYCELACYQAAMNGSYRSRSLRK